VVSAFAGTAVVAGWTLVPLLFFGVDETLDRRGSPYCRSAG